MVVVIHISLLVYACVCVCVCLCVLCRKVEGKGVSRQLLSQLLIWRYVMTSPSLVPYIMYFEQKDLISS